MIKEAQILISSGRIAISIPPTLNRHDMLTSAKEISPMGEKVFSRFGVGVQVLPFPQVDRVLTAEEICDALGNLMGLQ